MKTGLGEAMVIGQATIDGNACELAVMDFAFMGGSMGRVVGEKFALACESAADHGVPLFSVTASGGALLTVMSHPTTAGVLASFASLGDVTVAEPGALMSFTGPRVVEATTREKLPDDFGLAESNYRFGHLDAIVPRPELKSFAAKFLRVFGNVE
jgi:acetyl-CoA carboxylase carboxyl transferase subunit beta